MFSDVLTAGHGPPGCRQTTTMAEENVSCCTSTRPLNMYLHQHLQFQVQIPAVVEPLGSKPVILSPRNVTTNTPKPDLLHQPLYQARIATRTSDPKSMNSLFMDHEIGSRNPTSLSERIDQSRQRFVQSNQTASSMESIGSNPPAVIRITTSIREDRPVKQCHRTSCPILTRDTANLAQFIVSRNQDVPRRDAFTLIPDWCHLELETSMPTAVSWSLLQETPFPQTPSHHHHPQLQQMTVSYHLHHSLHPPVRSIPHHIVWLVILLLIGFYPLVLQAPGTGSERRQPHPYLQERKDFLRRSVYWSLLHLIMIQRINNDWFLPLRSTHQYRRSSLESHRIGSWLNHQFMIGTRVQRVIEIGFHQFRQLQRGFFLVVRTLRLPIRDTLLARESWQVLHQISLEGIRVLREALIILLRNTWRDRVRLLHLRNSQADFRGFWMSDRDRDLSSQVKDLMSCQCNDLGKRDLAIDTWPVNDIWRLARLLTMARWLRMIRIGKSFIMTEF